MKNEINLDYTISRMSIEDWPQMAKIYQEGIETKIATFETDVPAWEKWDKDHLQVCRLVAKSGNTILGWAALTPYSIRKVYAGVAEVSIYIGSKFQGHQVGTMLLKELIKTSDEFGFWTLQSTIIQSNTTSLHVHKKCGFREVGIREKLAKLDGIWLDVVLVEHRSKL